MNDFRADVARTMKGEYETMSYEQWKEYMNRYQKEQGALPTSGWAETELTKAKDSGVTDGTRPRALVTREEAAVMVVRGQLGKLD